VGTAATQRVTAAFRSGPLAVRSFRLLTAGQFASTIGDFCYAVALPWLVLSNHGSAALLGIVLACYGAPRTILMPVGGFLTDKIGPRTLMLFADVMRCVLVAVLAFLAARHSASLVTLGPIAALIGAGEGLFLPASFAIMPSLLDQGQLAPGNSLNFAAVQVGSLLGPALGGALVAISGSSTAVSALTLVLIPRRAEAGSMAAKSARAADVTAATADDLSATAGSLLGEPESLAALTDATQAGTATTTAERTGKPQGVLDYIRKSRAMQVILITAVVMNMANGGMNEVALPALAHARWGAGAYGALLACMAAGAVIGTLGAARTARLKAPGYIASIGFIVEGVAISLVPYLGGKVGAAVALLFIGVCGGVGNVIFFTVAQRHIPAAILGRVMGVLMMCGSGSYPLSVLVTGLLVRHLGTTPFFPLAGIILTISVIGGNTSREFRDFAHVPQPT
jgi:MFS family permease